MTPNTRKAIEAMAEDKAEFCYCAGPTCSGCEINTKKLFIEGAEAHEKLLLESAPDNFDYNAFSEWFFASTIKDGLAPFDWAVIGAKWMFQQDRLVIAALKAELAEAHEINAKWYNANKPLCDALFERDKLSEENERLRSALEDLFKLMDEGFLVRNIENDGDASWHLQMMPFVKRLIDARKAALAGKGE